MGFRAERKVLQMRKFDTKVQYLKYKVLREVARHAFNDTLLESFNDIAKVIVKGPKPTMRCCIYKERAIVGERMKIAMGGDKSNPNVIEVIDIACDECPEGGYIVTEDCRGCIAHRCEDVCRRAQLHSTSTRRRISINQNASNADNARRSAHTARLQTTSARVSVPARSRQSA